MRRGLIIYLLIVGILYLVYGFLEFIKGVIAWWLPWIKFPVAELSATIRFNNIRLNIPNLIADPFAGLVLIFTSLVYFRAVTYFRENKIDGWGFLIVGVILSVALAFLNILIVLADAIEAYYPLLWGQKPNESWNILTDEWMFNPMMILGVLILPLIKECLNWYRKSKSTQS